MCRLYELFLEYYTQKTGVPNPPLNESTYSKYFQCHLNFTFSRPHSDVCNTCFENRFNQESAECKEHKKNVEDYSRLKKSILADKTALCLEFDFGQNLPLPKIPVSDQFYKRLIWLHMFNVNVFGNHKQSYMYFF